jgi:hypothetical protein
VTWPKARIVEPAEMAIAMELLSKHPATTAYRGDRGNATLQEFWGEVFSGCFLPRLYKQEQLPSRDGHPCPGGLEYLHRSPV